MDAEYFQPQYLALENQLEKIGFKKLKEFQTKIKHPKEIKRKYLSEGVLFLRAQNVRPLSIDLTANPVFISESDAEHLKDNEINYKDILLTRTGANFGQCTIYLENTKAVASSHTLIIKSGNLNPYFLAVYLNTKYGRKLVDRGMYGGLQPEVSPNYLYQIPVPNFECIESKIEDVYTKSQSLIRSSKNIYSRARTALLNDLGLAQWRPKHCLTFINNYSTSKRARRIDAEYFQPKYDELIDIVSKSNCTWRILDDLVTTKKCVEVGSAEYKDGTIPFVRVSNLSPFEITNEKYVSKSLYERYKHHQPEQGEILFTKDGTPGIAHYLRDKPGEMIPSSGILRLKKKNSEVNNEYLTLVLNSIIVKEQVQRDVGGSVIQHWRPEQVKKALIPILDKVKRDEIEKQIIESYKLRKQSNQLLESAKRAVEIAIEKYEAVAVDWLQNEINCLDNKFTL